MARVTKQTSVSFYPHHLQKLRQLAKAYGLRVDERSRTVQKLIEYEFSRLFEDKENRLTDPPATYEAQAVTT